MMRQYKICLACKQAKPKKVIKLHLADCYCRKCGQEIFSPGRKGFSWDLIEEPVKQKMKITWVPGTISTYPFTTYINTSGTINITPWAEGQIYIDANDFEWKINAST